MAQNPHGELEVDQLWTPTIDAGRGRRIFRLGTGHSSGRPDLWYHEVRDDGSDGPLRSCFLDTWLRWQQQTRASLSAAILSEQVDQAADLPKPF